MYRLPLLDSFDGALQGGVLSDELSEVHDAPKALLKDMSRLVLPSGIVDRLKMGFPLPRTYYSQVSAIGSEDGTPNQEWIAANLELCDQGGWP